MSSSDEADEPGIPRYAWYVLGVLTLVYVLNFLDRSLIYILFTPIKKELALSDLQLALLGTTSFVIFYTLLGVPFGRLADRTTRKNLVAGGLFVWSLFSGLTGFAGDFWSIFFCRVMVGVGEATLGPAALSILSDYFPPRMRATVQAIYSSGIALGAGVAFFLGGWIGDAYGWRWAFYLLGFPGIVVAVAVFLLKEPKRTGVATSTPESADWRALARSVPLRFHHLGYALFAIAANSMTIWGPSFLSRVHDMSVAAIGMWTGLAAIVAGIPGTVLGGFFADRFRLAGRGGRMRFGAVGALVCIPLYLTVAFSPSLPTVIGCVVVLSGFALIWLGPAAADVHEIAGPRLRGLGIGVYFLVVNVIGYGIGPLVFGRLNDWLGAGTDPSQMRFTLLLAPGACVASAIVLWLGSRSIERHEPGPADSPHPESSTRAPAVEVDDLVRSARRP